MTSGNRRALALGRLHRRPDFTAIVAPYVAVSIGPAPVDQVIKLASADPRFANAGRNDIQQQIQRAASEPTATRLGRYTYAIGTGDSLVRLIAINGAKEGDSSCES